MEYLVEVNYTSSADPSAPLSTYSVRARYSKFMELDAALRSRFGALLTDVKLPPNTWLGSQGADFLQKRADDLNAYLQAVAAVGEGKVSQAAELRSFLNFQKRASLSTPGATAPGTPGALRSRSTSDEGSGGGASPLPTSPPPTAASPTTEMATPEPTSRPTSPPLKAAGSPAAAPYAAAPAAASPAAAPAAASPGAGGGGGGGAAGAIGRYSPPSSQRSLTPLKPGSPDHTAAGAKVPVTSAGTPHHFLPSTDEGKTHITAEPSIFSNGFGAKETTLIRATSAWEAANQHNHGTAHIAGQEAVPRSSPGSAPKAPISPYGSAARSASPRKGLANASLLPTDMPQGGKVVITNEPSFPFDTKTTLIEATTAWAAANRAWRAAPSSPSPTPLAQ